MMRHVRGLSCLFLLLLLTACGGKGSGANSQVPLKSTENPVDQIIKEQKGFGLEAETTESPETKKSQENNKKEQETEPTTSAELPTVEGWEIDGADYVRPENVTHDGIDLDLTVLSQNMIYAEVYNMVSYAPDYVGKKICMEGLAVSYKDEETGRLYYACLIEDAMACCQTGIEYSLASLQAKYPKDDERIKVTGIFETYTDTDGIEYCRLRNAILEPAGEKKES